MKTEKCKTCGSTPEFVYWRMDPSSQGFYGHHMCPYCLDFGPGFIDADIDALEELSLIGWNEENRSKEESNGRKDDFRSE